MSYVNSNLKNQFESLSIDLKNEILSRDVQINNLNDLIAVLQQIVDEEKSVTEWQAIESNSYGKTERRIVEAT